MLRIKGFLEVTGKPMRLLVQGVGPRFRQQFDRAWARGEARRGRLVVIGEKGIDRDAVDARPSWLEAGGTPCISCAARRDRSTKPSSAVDLGQTPAEIVFLSFSDSDLAGVADAWEAGEGKLPELAPRQSFGAAPSLLGRSLCRARGRACAFRAGAPARRARLLALRRRGAVARREGARLRARHRRRATGARMRGSRRPRPCRARDLARLFAYLQNGGAENLRELLAFIAHRLGRPDALARAAPCPGLRPLRAGSPPRCRSLAGASAGHAPHALVLLYRSAYLAADTLPITALADALAARGFRVTCAYRHEPQGRGGRRAARRTSRRRASPTSSSTPPPSRRGSTREACSMRPIAR